MILVAPWPEVVLVLMGGGCYFGLYGVVLGHLFTSGNRHSTMSLRLFGFSGDSRRAFSFSCSVGPRSISSARALLLSSGMFLM